MDKDELLHLADYKKEETYLAYRLKIVKALIVGLEKQQKIEKEGFNKAINETKLKQNYRRDSND